MTPFRLLDSVILSHFAMIAGVLMTLLIAPRLLRQRRSAPSTTAWLIVIVLAPWLGVPAYLAFGNRKLDAALMLKRPLGSERIDGYEPLGAAGAGGLLQSYGLPPAVPGNLFSLCADGVEIYRRFMEVIDGAQTRIHMASFILHPDPVGLAIVEALARRAGEGVEVRLMLDGVGSFHTSRRALDPLVRAGGEVAFFLPVRLVHFTRTNLRNHRKMLIADDRRVVAGGANVAIEYMGPAPDPLRWLDLSFLLEGPAARQYAGLFAADWKFVTGKAISLLPGKETPAGDAIVQIAPSGPDVSGDPVYAAIVSGIFSARRRLWIVTPYFIPPTALSEALVLAAHRGVDVRVYVPDPSNHALADLARGQPLRDAAGAGVRVLRFIGGMVHAKIVVIDDEVAMVGSVNIDPRSLFLNFEANALVYGPEHVGAVVAWIEGLKDKTEEGVRPVSNIRDTLEGVARILDPLL
jgi:cardiolipin synthase